MTDFKITTTARERGGRSRSTPPQQIPRQMGRLETVLEMAEVSGILEEKVFKLELRTGKTLVVVAAAAAAV